MRDSGRFGALMSIAEQDMAHLEPVDCRERRASWRCEAQVLPMPVIVDILNYGPPQNVTPSLAHARLPQIPQCLATHLDLKASNCPILPSTPSSASCQLPGTLQSSFPSLLHPQATPRNVKIQVFSLYKIRNLILIRSPCRDVSFLHSKA